MFFQFFELELKIEKKNLRNIQSKLLNIVAFLILDLFTEQHTNSAMNIDFFETKIDVFLMPKHISYFNKKTEKQKNKKTKKQKKIVKNHDMFIREHGDQKLF